MTVTDAPTYYYLRPVAPGLCGACGKPYPALIGRVYLTADGLVHPDCVRTEPPTAPDDDGLERKDLPGAPERAVPSKPATPTRQRPGKAPAKKGNPRDQVCRVCWTVHPPHLECVDAV